MTGGDNKDGGLGGKSENTVTSTATTNLKLSARKFKRELDAVRRNEADMKAEASRTLVWESLLGDASRMKTQYESDYLAAHREKLVLQNEL